jgi:DnaJ-class molecular chaperone
VAGDPYKELGVARGASADEIKKAFRKLAKELHPDKNPGDKVSEERFKRITAAFDLLGDAEKRAKFDRGEIDADGREQFRAPPGGGGRSGGFGGFGGSGGRGGFEDIDLEELFGAFGGGGRTAGRGGFGGGKGQDVRATLDISLEDSIAGTTRRIQFSDGRMLDVVIPKGASEGQVIRLKGQGAPGRGGQAGDALIELKIAPHPVFKRDDADLTMDLPVSVRGDDDHPQGLEQRQDPAAQGARRLCGGQARGPVGQAGGDAAGNAGRRPDPVRDRVAGQAPL